MKLGHKCVEARWNEETSKWHVKIQNLATKEIHEDIGDVFMTGIGSLNEWKWPDLKGLHDFKGPLLHSANWDPDFDPKDKTVAVIGAGSSGIQIVPSLLPHVKAMDHYVRGRTWIASTFGNELVRARNEGQDGNFEYTNEEKDTWKKDPASYLKYRKALEFGMQGGYAVTQRGSKEHASAREAFDKDMRERLSKKPEVADHLVPDFPPLCKRLTPGPGYLEALIEDKTTVIPNKISHIDETGIVTEDGKHRPVDAIICATGFDTSFQGRFPIYGRGGFNMQDKYKTRPATYLSITTDRFPNFFQSLGPNSAVGNGNLLMVIEATAHYVAQILQKLSYGNLKTIEPKRKQVENFTNYCDAYFKRTVFSAECGSWYKSSPPNATPEERKNGRITALWPGSSVHAIRALEKVRFEDFDMTTVDDNEFGWIGNGWVVAEKIHDVEGLTWYLNDTKFTHIPLEDEEKRLDGGAVANGTDLQKGEIEESPRVPEGIVAT